MSINESDLDYFVALGQAHADLVAQLEAAVKAGDRERAWELARLICHVEELKG
jgi:hypothetical protein